MLVKKKVSKIKKMSLIAAVMSIVAFMGYLIFTNFVIEEDGLIERGKLKVVEIATPQVLNSKFSDDFVDRSPFTDLILPSRAKLPVTVDEMGRTNPFQEISF